MLCLDYRSAFHKPRPSASLYLDVKYLFFIVTLGLQMHVTDFVRSPRDGSVWGNRKKHNVSAYCLGHCYQPHAGGRGSLPRLED